MGGKSGSAGEGGAYTVPKWLLKDFKIVKSQNPTVKPKNIKVPMDSSNSSNKLKVEVNSQRNSTKGTGKSVLKEASVASLKAADNVFQQTSSECWRKL